MSALIDELYDTFNSECVKEPALVIRATSHGTAVLSYRLFYPTVSVLKKPNRTLVCEYMNLLKNEQRRTYMTINLVWCKFSIDVLIS